MEEGIYLYSIHKIPAITAKDLARLVSFFDSPRAMWEAGKAELEKAGVESAKIPEILFAKSRTRLQDNEKFLKREGISVITIRDASYPEILKTIHTPPPLLYARGEIRERDDAAIGVVGTRKMTPYGKEVTEPLVRDLVSAGFTIVSGMARGIDTLAHEAALKHGGRTIAVLGSGIDEQTLYPSQNRRLARLISKNGAVISEFAPASMSLPEYFPQRNRIIAGLAKGVLVIEAPEKSGALITARFALEEGRDVFAVPGHVFSKNSAGTHRLIKTGAKLVESARDILEEFGIHEEVLAGRPRERTSKLRPEEETILAALEHHEGSVHIDALAQTTKIEIHILSSALIMMELEGMVKNLGNNMYTILR